MLYQEKILLIVMRKSGIPINQKKSLCCDLCGGNVGTWCSDAHSLWLSLYMYIRIYFHVCMYSEDFAYVSPVHSPRVP